MCGPARYSCVFVDDRVLQVDQGRTILWNDRGTFELWVGGSSLPRESFLLPHRSRDGTLRLDLWPPV